MTSPLPEYSTNDLQIVLLHRALTKAELNIARTEAQLDAMKRKQQRRRAEYITLLLGVEFQKTEL